MQNSRSGVKPIRQARWELGGGNKGRVEAQLPIFKSPELGGWLTAHRALLLGGSLDSSFQSAPRPCERGDAMLIRFETARLCFNPRRALASAATSRHRLANPEYAVSIRAAPLRARRRRTSRLHRRQTMFQSAPRPCERGDTIRAFSTREITKFQSAPRPCERGD